MVVVVHLHTPGVQEGELQRGVPLLRRGFELARQERIELLEGASHLLSKATDTTISPNDTTRHDKTVSNDGFNRDRTAGLDSFLPSAISDREGLS